MTRNEQTAAEKRAPNFRRESKGDLTVAGDPMSIEGRVAFGGCSGSVFGMLAGAVRRLFDRVRLLSLADLATH